MTGYYRRLVQHHATIAEPLTEMTKKNQPNLVEWTTTAELVFQRLKSMLTSAPLMKNPDFTRTFILQTDASGVGIGAVLNQGEESDHPIAYFSRKLLPREKPILLSRRNDSDCPFCKTISGLPIGRFLIIHTCCTHHRALQWLRHLNPRLTQWSLILL